MASPRFVASIALLVVCSFHVSRADDAPEGEELVKEVVSKPEKCERLTKRLDMLSMHYTGTLAATGAKFDSSLDRGEPFTFQLGVGQVIQGWEKGLVDMCVGEKRKLTVPAHLAYGDQGAGELIPPKSNLVFEVELMDIKDGETPPNVFKQIDANDDKVLSHDEVSGFLKEQAKKAGPESTVNEEQHSNIVNQIFEHEDKDRDGFISHEEFSGPKHDEL